MDSSTASIPSFSFLNDAAKATRKAFSTFPPELPYFHRNGILGDRAILVHIVICLVRAPLLAVLVTQVAYILLGWLTTATQWHPAVIFTFCSMLVHETIFLGFTLFSHLCNKYNWLAAHRLPRHAGQAASTELKTKVIKETAFIHAIIQPITLLGLFFGFADAYGIHHPQAPMTRNLLEQWWFFFVLNILNEIATYVIHRSMHSPKLYVRIHKCHHRFKGAMVIGGEHAHWFEHFIGTQLTVYTFCTSKEHMVLWLVWVAWKVWETSELHSGYDLSKTFVGRLGLLMGRMAFVHDHHHTVNCGNFGSYQFMDYAFGTMDSFLASCTKRRLEKEAAAAGTNSSVDARTQERNK